MVIRKPIGLFVSVVAVAAVLGPMAGPAAAATLTVNSAADDTDGSCDASPGDCTFREAIGASNLSTGVLDTIEFALGTGTPTISPTSALPTISDPAIVNGATGGATR